MLKDFIIPLNKDELLTSHAGQYNVEKILLPSMISKAVEASRTALETDGACFILTCFDTFFSVLLHSNKLELRCILLSFRRVFKGIKILVADMEKIFDQGKEIEEEERPKLLCLNKMFAYLISQITCHIDQRIAKNSSTTENTAQRKKNTKTDEEADWDNERQKVLELIYRWLQLPLHKLWKPSIVEDSFVTTLSQVCYSILEHCTNVKQKHTRQTIFEILGTLSKKYNHGIICIVRIVQLVKLYDTLPAYIATGVVHMDTECGCNGFLKQVIREIGQTELVEAESRNISIFLDNIALLKPDIMLPIMDDILEYLASEYYTMRNCAIGVIGTVIQKVLTGEHLAPEQKEQRDECLNSLYEHILDCNAYVRSKVLQVWQNLCCEGSIPLSRQTKLLTACVSRLQDKSATVRKQALQLLRTLLQSNPFAAKLDEVEFLKSMEREQIKLKELQSQFTSDSSRGDSERLELWNTLLPDIRRAIENIIDNHTEKENKEGVTDREKDDNEDIDPNYAFEKIRQLILREKVSKAVSYLWSVCTKLQDGPKIENLSPEAQEECLFAFLFKIFIESEGGSNKHSKQKASIEENMSQQYKEQKEEIKAQKRLVDYLKHSTEFATKFKNAIPLVEALLFSTTASDAVEACALLGIATQFGVTGANTAMRKALFQAFHRDQSVRRNLAVVYKQLYLDDTDSQTPQRQKANSCVKSLIHLVKELQPGQSPALEELITSWYNNKEISEETLQILWEKFSMKSSDTMPIESRAALILIMMISKAESNIILDNLHVLVKIGLGPRAKTDLLLARDTCRILQKIEQGNRNIEIAPIRFPNDHDIFKEITTLLTENFFDLKENGYISFATDAINVIYKLADNPHQLIKSLLLNILERGQFTATHDNQLIVSNIMLSNLLYLVGHIAIKEMVYLDTAVYKEMKRRNLVKELKKNKNSNKNNTKHYESLTSSVSLVRSNNTRNAHNKESSILEEDNGEDALEGAADDADAELINTALESEIVTGNGLLTKFVPIVLDVCQQPKKYNNEDLQAASTLALCKMMTVSSSFCEQSLQLLVTILERSAYPEIRANVLIGLNDLTTRFPNEVEPWTKHIYGRLQDKDKHVRSTCVRVLSNLIMREMVRVKGQVSELALCIIDEDVQIQQDTKHFFKELSQRGNALYNIIPDILSRLSDPQLNLSESSFQEIFGYILGLVQKEKQIEAIIEKICARFKLATTERLWCDLSYCLSILQFSAKSIRYLIESLPVLKDKIHHKQVLKTLQGIIDHTKKKPDAKDTCLELEEKIKELLKSDNNEMNDNMMLPPPTLPQNKKTRKVNRKDSEKEDENSSDSDSDSEPVLKKNLPSRRAKKTPRISNVPSDSNSELDDANNQQMSPRIQQRKTKVNTTKMKSHLKHLELSPSTRSPLPKRNRSSKAGETPAAASQKSTKTPVQRATRSSRSSARLLNLQK